MNANPKAHRTPGMLLLLLGLVFLAGTAVLLILLWVGERSRDGVSFQAFSLQVAGIGGLGLTLCLLSSLLGWRFWTGRPLGPFWVRHPWALLFLFLALLPLGTVLALWETAPAFLLPALHVLTLLTLHALVLIALGTFLGNRAGSWQDVLGGLLGGASLGAGAAILLEVGIALALGAFFVLTGQVPQEWLRGSIPSLQGPEDAMALVQAIPPLLVLTGIVFLTLLAPLVEEMTKTLAVGLVGPWLRPDPARAFLLGAASGAGFALAENFLNSGFFGLLWGGGILARLAATVMHTATGALMGWGWGQWWTERKYLRLPLAFAGAFGIHALWNGTVGVLLGTAYFLVRSGAAGPEISPTLLLSALIGLSLMFLALFFQVFVFLAVSAGLLIAARSLRRHSGER
ncbi:MAG: PrsW family glutamic-type intramembrane protease [Anaerolineae bacterium]|nr:PrsW family intramembrane metalloprotease [Anaerolineae bacterium]MCX8067725.1 PrsW family intramembrane metalloprotease [Anaerolineae bacterium]MDW7991303.1 PrsW family glutamic-type intramembrane protease [Anaerolineae bacterium]